MRPRFFTAQVAAFVLAASAADFTSETLVYKKAGDRELHLYVEKPAGWKSDGRRPQSNPKETNVMCARPNASERR